MQNTIFRINYESTVDHWKANDLDTVWEIFDKATKTIFEGGKVEIRKHDDDPNPPICIDSSSAFYLWRRQVEKTMKRFGFAPLPPLSRSYGANI